MYESLPGEGDELVGQGGALGGQDGGTEGLRGRRGHIEAQITGRSSPSKSVNTPSSFTYELFILRRARVHTVCVKSLFDFHMVAS